MTAVLYVLSVEVDGENRKLNHYKTEVRHLRNEAMR